MAKKKKTQLKPVARGFATTSLPKKIIPASTDILRDNPDLLESTKPDGGNDITDEDDSAFPAVAANEDANRNNSEEQYLQSLVDKLQEKTEKEVLRYLVLFL
jgi:ATP-dependent RNA helicase DHX29